ncbi:MAG: hypothetical protein BWX86_01762 [Verrucomicrobia bacterium ADurb.Bin122]|nr:MAG: hypothetical protein BWX86_01762 [Verrucomicrobia bacterium ADurb.Bin122]
MSSMFEMPTSFEAFCMPSDSSWNTATVLPELSNLYVAGSSMEIFSMSKSGFAVRRTFFTASSMTVSVFRPRKSIFSRPSLPTEPMSNCTVTSPSCEVSGTKSSSGWSVMMMPAACLPVLRTRPSMMRPHSKIFLAMGLRSHSARSSADFSMALASVMSSSSGIIFAMRSASANGRSWMRAMSRTTILAPNVPYVMMLATQSRPYFSRT